MYTYLLLMAVAHREHSHQLLSVCGQLLRHSPGLSRLPCVSVSCRPPGVWWPLETMWLTERTFCNKTKVWGGRLTLRSKLVTIVLVTEWWRWLNWLIFLQEKSRLMTEVEDSVPQSVHDRFVTFILSAFILPLH